MNFLAHFLLTNRSDTPEYQLGGLLPDIAKRAQILVKPVQLIDISPQFLQFKSGIELHWNADRHFHNSELFGLGMELWKMHLHGFVPTDISKTFFLYHLLFEMWLDRVLMADQPDADQTMYSQLDKVHPDSLQSFAIQVLGDQDSKLVRTFQGFQRRRFVSLYRKPEAFSEIAMDVFNRVTGQFLNQQFRDEIELALTDLEADQPEILIRWKQLKIEILS